MPVLARVEGAPDIRVFSEVALGVIRQFMPEFVGEPTVQRGADCNADNGWSEL